MKMALSNERTLIAWVRVGATYGAGAVVAAVITTDPSRDPAHRQTSISLTVQALLGLLIVAWGVVQFVRRGKMLAARWHGSYEAHLGPAAFAIATIISVLLTMSVSLRRIEEYYSDDCLYLPGLSVAQMANATPPFLYISFHGTSNPRKAMCNSKHGVAAVHRFTLSGAYAGPATDQRDAMVHMPRGMAAINGLLVVADSYVEDSSLVFFGACVNAGVRPFLGRIRPDDKQMRASFEHPYGVVTSRDDPSRLLVSSQDGGTIVAVDTTTGEMSVERQVSVRVAKDSPTSGHLRGLAVDSNGCEHVADKHADAVWHYCPDNVVTMTQISKPIDLFVDGALLYVGSFDNKMPAVHVLDLQSTPGKHGKKIVRSFTHRLLVHPAGMLVHSHLGVKSLYVLEQTTLGLLKFDVNTTNFVSSILSDLPDVPEKVHLVNEC